LNYIIWLFFHYFYIPFFKHTFLVIIYFFLILRLPKNNS
jgi:hypothetical protein